MIVAAILVIFPFCMAHAAVSDLLSMTIANRVSAVLIVSFLVLAPLCGMEWSVIGIHFATAACILAVTFVLFSLGTMGGGDAKLLAATSLWFGFGIPLVEYLATAAILGGILTFGVLMFRGSALAVYGGQIDFLRKIGSKDAGVPYGIALGFAGLLTFPSSPLGIWVLAQLVNS
jgi:prepilin peptidase CpaA